MMAAFPFALARSRYVPSCWASLPRYLVIFTGPAAVS